MLRLERNELLRSRPPYPLSSDTLFVTYDAPAPLGCHLVLGWPMPDRVLDLHAEFRCLTSGLVDPGDYPLESALAHFDLNGEGLAGMERLLNVMRPQVSLGHALLRGRYTPAVARMESVGIPIDLEALALLREGWRRIEQRFIQAVDRHYGVYDGGEFNPRRWMTWVNKNHIPWPRLAPRRLDLSLDTFRDMAKAYPEVRPMKELRATLALMRPCRLAVGADGRNRCPLRPFASKTGRNQPSTAEFIFGPASWVRGLIKPQEGMALAYIDYEQQEFGIAAALSGDRAMVEAYGSDDPYLAFAKQAGAVPADATKATHPARREQFKLCALGVQYGMGARSLACLLGGSRDDAQARLRAHKRTYSTYWKWSREVQKRAYADGKLQATFGWTVHVGPDSNPRSLRNFPLQANGAEMLRLACCRLTEAGVRVCAPVHDALLIEAPAKNINQAVAVCQEAMRWASEQVLKTLSLRTEAKVVGSPGRYTDGRGRDMWAKVFSLLGQEGVTAV